MTIPNVRYLSQLLWKYKFILAVGAHCTGKTQLLGEFIEEPNWTNTKWSRQPILEMLFSDGVVDPKFFSHIAAFEQSFMPDLTNRTLHRIIVESWGTAPSTRRKWLDLVGNAKTCCLVFDGPTDMIASRALSQNRLNLDKVEMKHFIEEQKLKTTWPTFEEGWNDIIYVNTFGERGIEYLTGKVYQRER